MPLLEHRNLSDHSEYGQWLIKETSDWFLERLNLHESEKDQLDSLKGRRKLEWLAARWLLHLMSGRLDRTACLKDPYGKPYLVDSSYHISMSHSNNRVAVIASPKVVGIDIQKIVPKIKRIAHKFMSKKERESLYGQRDVEFMHLYWGAKECLYKGYGRKDLDFKKHLLVQSFPRSGRTGKTTGCIVKSDYRAEYDIYYEIKDSYVLVYAILCNN